MHYLYKKTFFNDFSFDICENVYDPAEDSFFFAENLDVKAADRILDMGTGCGLLGILVAEKGNDVLAVDINPYALRCAKHNAQLNKVDNKLSFLRSDLFSGLYELKKFDLILFNAPYVISEDCETNFWLGRSWAGGSNGRLIIDRFVGQVSCYLNKFGQIFLLQSNFAGVDDTILGFSRKRLKARVMATLNLPFFEQLVLINASFQ
jgi:release factor glutamine methyltransferase